jgi:hypothetical protein
MSAFVQKKGQTSKEAFQNLGPAKRAQENLKEAQKADSELASSQRKVAQSGAKLSASTRARRGMGGSYGLMSDKDTLG